MGAPSIKIEEFSAMDIAKQFDFLRQNLLDLTMRNPLLNFRPGTRTIEVVDEVPTEIYEILVLKEKKSENQMQFKDKPGADEYEELKNNISNLLKGNFTENELTPELVSFAEILARNELKGKSVLWELPPPDTSKLFLQTRFSSAELQRRLFYINQRARSVIEEQGYNQLYLAIGFLKWKESGIYRKAPLILVPVELERKKVKGSFKLRWNGDEIATNISLQAKLKEQGVELPDFEMPETKEGVNQYLQKVKKCIPPQFEWEVLNRIFLGFFSFYKFVMFKDLDPISWPGDDLLAGSPIIQEMYNPTDDLGVGFDEGSVDLLLSSDDIYHVVDADSSQIAVIEDAKSGRNMVVEGPPGTGKSQTIVNLIAELIAAGNTILFVSEKMAALEVVKTRLDRIGLGEFCLEIHSHKSKKKEILKELETTINNTRDLEIESEEEFNKMEQLKVDLNQYIELLHTPYGKIKYTPYYLFGLKERSLLHFKNRKLPRFKVKDSENLKIQEWNTIHSRLRDISELLNLIQPIKINPWRNCQVNQIYPTDQEDIKRLTERSIKLLDELNTRIFYLVKITGIKPPETLDDLNTAFSSAKIMAQSLPVEKEVILGDSWDIQQDQGYKFIRDLESLNKYDKKVFSRLDKRILNEDIRVLLEEYKSHSSKLFKFLSRDFKKLKDNISSYYKEKLPSNEIVISDLEEAFKYQKVMDEIRKNEKSGRNLFGQYWGSVETDTQSLIDFSQWIIPLKDGLNKDLITDLSIEIVSNGVNGPEIRVTLTEISQIREEFKKTMEELDGYLHFDRQAVLARSLEDLHNQLDVFNGEIHSLHKWSQFIQGLNSLSKTRAEGMVDLIYSDSLNPDDVSFCFEANFADSLLKTVFYNHPEISGFIGKLHEKKIDDFRKLDQNLIELNRHRIIKEVYDRRPPLNISVSPNSQLGILKSEFARKRGHMAPRKLFKETGGLIQKIKPCFMMSPLSVAQYLDPAGMGDLRFDYVIFDEASQVKPEDALGSFLRAKKAVIMGDTRQLPPTSFFDAQSDIDDDSDNQLNTIKDMESILQLAKSRGFPSKMLRWHYRSRHESLIAVSNQEFYSNELLVYPSPCHDSKYLGLKFVYLPDTVYERGRSGKNQKEAGCVIQAAFQHYQKYGNSKSLGVGTFNVRQQQAILEELELQLRLHPEMEEFFTSSQDEHFFVKNLETIQGDERDVILVSIGFGFDQNHKLTHNFGPLNYDGGERRLNVLITRAREQCIIFANFKARDLEIKPSSSFGLKALKVFLEYAETKNLENIDDPGEDAESPFEESVYHFLKINNYNVHKQVGCAGYRIDLAVVDPEHSGRYLIGVECDGAMYHSSPVARDRDRLRQQVLEGLGWTFHRIWSTDWYRSRDESQRNLLKAIENAGKVKNRKPVISDHLKVEELVKEIEPVKEKSMATAQDEVPDYQICSSIDVDTTEDLQQIPITELSKAIVQIVEIEGPIHKEELIKRIRTLWGIKRAGKKIKDILSSAIETAENDGDLLIKEEFLYPVNQKIIVRKRSKGQPTNIRLICDEEITEAIKMVIKQQFATPPDELKKQVANLFGIKVVRAATADRINSVIKEQVKNGTLEETANGMINLSQ